MPVQLRKTDIDEKLGDLNYDWGQFLGKSPEDEKIYFDKTIKEHFQAHKELQGKNWSWERSNDWKTGIQIILIKMTE